MGFRLEGHGPHFLRCSPVKVDRQCCIAFEDYGIGMVSSLGEISHSIFLKGAFVLQFKGGVDAIGPCRLPTCRFVRSYNWIARAFLI